MVDHLEKSMDIEDFRFWSPGFRKTVANTTTFSHLSLDLEPRMTSKCPTEFANIPVCHCSGLLNLNHNLVICSASAFTIKMHFGGVSACDNAN